ncbi:MAG: hypothetical protein LAO23_09665 [Acidobacteriia bacterium]|nr:hypothetical protein [Terriglobia bacterium]
MKTTLFLLCLLFTTAAFAQRAGMTSNSQPQVYEFQDHPAFASYAPMARERSILASTSFSFGQGERPASDFPQQATAAETVSLGAIARELRQQHALVKKSRVVWVNQ